MNRTWLVTFKLTQGDTDEKNQQLNVDEIAEMVRDKFSTYHINTSVPDCVVVEVKE